jgi:hypothetical protein
VLSVHSTSEAVEDGEKNHTAAGRYCWMRGTAAGREAPQFMNPIPIGRVAVGAMVEEERRDWACERCVERSEVSVPAPMKPRPPIVALVVSMVGLKLMGGWSEVGHGLGHSTSFGDFDGELSKGDEAHGCSYNEGSLNPWIVLFELLGV